MSALPLAVHVPASENTLRSSTRTPSTMPDQSTAVDTNDLRLALPVSTHVALYWPHSCGNACGNSCAGFGDGGVGLGGFGDGGLVGEAGTGSQAESSCIMNGKSNESSGSEKPCCLSPANCVMRRKLPMRRIEPYTGTPLPRIGWRSHE